MGWLFILLDFGSPSLTGCAALRSLEKNWINAGTGGETPAIYGYAPSVNRAEVAIYFKALSMLVGYWRVNAFWS